DGGDRRRAEQAVLHGLRGAGAEGRPLAHDPRRGPQSVLPRPRPARLRRGKVERQLPPGGGNYRAASFPPKGGNYSAARFRLKAETTGRQLPPKRRKLQRRPLPPEGGNYRPPASA